MVDQHKRFARTADAGVERQANERVELVLWQLLIAYFPNHVCFGAGDPTRELRLDLRCADRPGELFLRAGVPVCQNSGAPSAMPLARASVIIILVHIFLASTHASARFGAHRHAIVDGGPGQSVGVFVSVFCHLRLRCLKAPI